MKTFPAFSRRIRLLQSVLALLVVCHALPGFGQSSCVAPPVGLTNWWPGQNNANDVIGGLNGTLSNGTSFAVGVVGQAFSFNGINQYVTNAVPALTNVLNSYTMEFWAWPAASLPITPESTTGTSGDANQRYAIFPHNGRFGPAGAGVSVGTNGISVFEHASAYLPSLLVHDVTITNWVHIAVVYSNQQPRLYLNGALARTGLVSSRASYPSTCLGENGLGYGYYAGLLDEVSLYDRPLTEAEVLAIYNAGAAGKCGPPTPPEIITQPTNQTVLAGGTASFYVGATGTLPMDYQWQFNGTNLASGTNALLTLTNVQASQAGNYQVVVTNVAGGVTSAVAVLTVTACTPGLAGLVAFYAAEGNALDLVGTNHGTASNTVTYVAGKVGQGFHFDGGSYIRVPANPSLVLSNEFTIELWYKAERTNATEGLIARRNSESAPLNFNISMLTGSYLDVFYNDPGVTGDTDVGSSVFEISRSTPAPPAGAFHHVAAVFRQAAANTVEVLTFIDGQLVRTRSFGGVLGRAANSAPITIGASIEYPGYERFQGTIDEVAFYNRALSSNEVQWVYSTISHGQCTAPIVFVQPTNQTVVIGNTAMFAVLATGSLPLAYQWTLNGTDLPGATTNVLVLTDVQTNQAGNYAVQISNSVGVTNSATAVLTVLPVPPCLTAPSNMVSWWRAEGGAADEVSGNHGLLSNGVSFAALRAGQGFVFNGSGAVVQLGNPPNLQVQDFTIEAWIRRTSSSVVSLNGNGNGYLFGYDNGGYAVYLNTNGVLTLNKFGATTISTSAAITDTNLHHLAIAKSGSAVVFYVDGLAYPASSYNPGFTFAGNVSLGGIGTNFTFLGAIDELAVYGRALSASEVQSLYNAVSSGKCVAASFPPFFVTHPTNQTVLVGANATFTCIGAGTPPLTYQWNFNGQALSGATNTSLTVSNVQAAQAGTYAVSATGPGGTGNSSNATLTITYPPAAVRVVSTNVTAGNPVTVSVTLAANGNENALAFSLNYDTTRLNFAGAAPGGGAAGAWLQSNTTQTNLGRIGVAVILPFGAMFAPGTQTVAQVTFNTAVFTNTTVNSTVSFGDQPTARQLLDNQPALLSANYSSGTVTISPATAFEGDAYPRPGGDRANSLIDWLYLGRYVARLDYPTNAVEFQRADSAPRSTYGDGILRATDWVQAGRYAFGLDSQTPAGGPTNETAVTAPSPSATRLLTASGATLLPGETATVSVSIAAQGNENAVGFSVSFDPALVSLTGAALGTGAGGATYYLNTNQLATGKIGFLMGWGIGSTFSPGTKELLRLNFMAAAATTGSFPATFVDTPVPREISDSLGLSLPVSFGAGDIVVYALPSLSITAAGENVLLGWPLWASNFTLQEAANDLAAPPGWTDLAVSPVVTNGENVVALPITNSARFYRLFKP